MSNRSVEERVGILEYSREDQERRIINLEEDRRQMDRMAVILQKQDDRSERQDEQFYKITETLNEINNNLTSLNNDVAYVKNKQNDVDGRVSNLEKYRFNQVSKFKDKSISFYLKIIAGIIVAAILFWLGLK